MLKFRPHRPKDIPYRIKWLNNKKITRFFVDDPRHKTNLAEQKKWFEKYKKTSAKKFFTILSYNKPIGLVGLSKINPAKKSADIFIVIGEDDFRGKGIGKKSMAWLIDYAFKKLKLKRLYLAVKRNNKIAIKLYKSRGFIPRRNNSKEITMELNKMIK